MTLFRKRAPVVESRTLTRDSLPPVMVAPATAGEAPNTRNATGISAVFSCVRCLVDAAILCPPVVYRKQGDGSRQRVGGGQLVGLLERPAPAVTGPALVAQLVQHLALFGECFIGKVKPTGGVEALEALPPDRVQVELKNGEPRYEYFAPLGKIYKGLTTSDVVHVRGMTLDGIRGASPVTVCREAMGLASALTTAGSAVWANSAVPSGILRVQSGPSAQDQANSLATAWDTRHRGAEKRGRIAVVTGEVAFQQVSMTLADAEYVEQCKMSLQETARIFGIPPSRINAPSNDSLTYSTTEAEATMFATHALMPRLTLIEKAISADPDLCSSPVYCEFDLTALLRADSTSRAAFYTQALNPSTGWMSRNEVREREGLPPDDVKPPVAPPALPQLVPQPPRDPLHGDPNMTPQEAA